MSRTILFISSLSTMTTTSGILLSPNIWIVVDFEASRFLYQNPWMFSLKHTLYQGPFCLYNYSPQFQYFVSRKNIVIDIEASNLLYITMITF